MRKTILLAASLTLSLSASAKSPLEFTYPELNNTNEDNYIYAYFLNTHNTFTHPVLDKALEFPWLS